MPLFRRNLQTFLHRPARATIRNGHVLLHGEPVQLGHKARAVLEKLVEAAPEPVSRGALIEEIWLGNFFTGEKGLRQAIWTIRSALGDDAAAPAYIRTIPRQGYCWIGPRETQPTLPGLRPGVSQWAALGLVALTLTLGGTDARQLPTLHAEPPSPAQISRSPCKEAPS